MQRRPLGRSGLSVVPFAFGGNVFGWTADEPTSMALLDRFVDQGFDFIDTADVYSRWAPGNQGGESETIIGRWLKRRGGRDRLVIVTKVGSDLGEGRKGLSSRWITQAVEGSLKRLQTDHIDLYLSHWPDPEASYEDTLGAYARLIEAGKVRAIGVSNVDAAQLEAALATSAALGVPRYEVLQMHYNLVERAGYEGPLEDLVVREGLGTMAYFALASGFLTGKYRSPADQAKSPRGEGMAKHLTPRGLAILAALDDIAARHRATPAQVALAWLLARPSVTAPIASATSLAQLDELLGAGRIALDAADLAQLDATR